MRAGLGWSRFYLWYIYEEYHEYDEYEVDEAENECEVNADLDEESEITLSESQMVNTDVVVHED